MLTQAGTSWCGCAPLVNVSRSGAWGCPEANRQAESERAEVGSEVPLVCVPRLRGVGSAQHTCRLQSWLPAGCSGGHCCLLGMAPSSAPRAGTTRLPSSPGQRSARPPGALFPALPPGPPHAPVQLVHVAPVHPRPAGQEPGAQVSPHSHLPVRPGAQRGRGTRLRHLTQHLPSSFLRALQPFLPSPGCTTAPGRGPFSGHCFLGTEHAGPVSLLQVTIRAGSQAQSSPRSPGHAHGCLHTVPRGHQMTLCGWQVWGWAGPAWGRERSGRTGRPCPLTADLGPSSGAPGSVRGLTRPPREPVSPPSAPTPCFPF